MGEPSIPLTTLSEAQRRQALERFAVLRPALEEGVSQTQIARDHQMSLSTVQRWIKSYREKGLAGLAPAARSDKGKSRSLPEQAITLVEGLALQTPPRSAAAIHRQVVEIAKDQGWKPPSYERVRQIIKNLDPALTTLAHQGAAAYREAFDLLYRREATHANAMWQADHTPLDVMLLDEEGKPAKPYLTAIEDDYSRLIVGYRLSFQAATALTTALTLRQAIWSKDDPRWSACGIPTVFYTDHGSDFTSKHLEQVAGDIGMELVFSKIGVPRGRGKVERFFRSVDQLFLQDVPGYSPKGYPEAKAVFTLPAFEQRFRKWLLEDFHHRVHSETGFIPKDRWEAGGYVPRMPTSLEQLDLLLLTVAKTRRVQQDGIHFQNHRYMDITLAAFVKEEVLIRYDPADMGEIHVFYRDRFLCRAICAELSDRKVTLKEIEQARTARRKQVRAELNTREAMVNRYVEMHHAPPPPPKTVVTEPAPVEARTKLKRYIND
ncbi:DDE-type integrase/transposase/recombinase [Ktedonobacter sp. SOSP1-52]|uniref:Mu transposase C-terminal domain-containing protein n=1 Tax=Ktedonobacter sp. SOSP1-52 TaxID=2778366 RepID=UPI0019164BEB|nr:Mu transposase C-terminal domain-containing protein [Ktedonobacter sp. SOSP1-52]GHO71551.1 DDE-type integrase/transposase/recombinase [Ktedonobacter sp. SOSP1-52]